MSAPSDAAVAYCLVDRGMNVVVVAVVDRSNACDLATGADDCPIAAVKLRGAGHLILAGIVAAISSLECDFEKQTRAP